MSGKNVRQPTDALVATISVLLWDWLAKAPGFPDRRLTTWGNKTKLGLAASILRIVDEQMPPEQKGGAG